MNVYVASKFQRKEDVRALQKALVENGHAISADWTTHEYADVPKEELPAFLRKCAMEDLWGVLDADMLVLLPDETAGAHFTELGIALGLCIPVIVMGHDPEKHARNIFYNLSALVFVKDIEGVLGAIKDFEQYATKNLKKGGPVIDIT